MIIASFVRGGLLSLRNDERSKCGLDQGTSKTSHRNMNITMPVPRLKPKGTGMICKNMRSLIASSIAIGATILLSTAASGHIIDLSSAPIGSFTTPMTFGAYVLTPRNLGSSPPTIAVVNGIYVVAATCGCGNGNDTFLTRADGGIFTLNAVDIGLLPGYGTSGQGVGTTTSGYGLNDVATATLQTIHFGTQFVGITSIDLDANGGAYFANINVGGVPEPATWALLMIGFGGIGVAARSRRSYKSLTA